MLIAILSFAGTCIGTIGGIIVSNKLISYRLEQLEKKVNLHNNAVERLFRAEGQITELQHEIKELKGRKV